MEAEELSFKDLNRAHKLRESATRIEQYILSQIDNWLGFRESYLANDDMRILNMHEDLDGSETDWRKILLVFNEPDIGNYPVLTIFPPKPGTNLKHTITIELMDKDKDIDSDNLFWVWMFRSKLDECGINYHCKEKLYYDEKDGYKVKFDFQAKLKLSYDKLVNFLDQYNDIPETIRNKAED